MPVFFWKASSVGRDLPSSLVSMYSVQFDQLTTFSVSDMSCAAAAVLAGATVPDAPPPVAGFLPAEPQAARKAAALTPAAPIIAERRLTRPRASAARKTGLSVSKDLSFMGSSPGVSWGSVGGISADPRWWCSGMPCPTDELAPPAVDGARLRSRCWP